MEAAPPRTLKRSSSRTETGPVKREASFTSDALTQVVMVSAVTRVAVQRWRRARARRVLAKS